MDLLGYIKNDFNLCKIDTDLFTENICFIMSYKTKKNDDPPYRINQINFKIKGA